MKFLFCLKCHRRIIPPKWIMNSNIKSEGGITLQCGYKDMKGQCKGKVKFKPKNNGDNNQTTEQHQHESVAEH